MSIHGSAGTIAWGLLLSLAALGTAVGGPAEAIAQEDSVTVQAGAHYQRSDLASFFLGDGYRDLWASPVTVPVLSPDTFAGGLELLQRGGGRQTMSLRFASRDRGEWVFRSVDKDQTGGLHPDLQETLVDWMVQDQISSKHPAAALVVDPLLDAVGVLHARPRLAVLRDHPALGEFRGEFGGMLGYLEERPDEPPEDAPKPYYFEGHERVIGSDRFLERIRESPEDRPDPHAYLTARLMDLLVGDWDRHEDQWRWAEVERNGTRYWLAVPRDRDNAFFHADGLMEPVGSLFRPFVISFDESYPSLYGLTYNARPLDRLILPVLTLQEWYEVAGKIQERLTDEVIADAVRQLPSPYYEASGAELERKLIARRDRLDEVVPVYYRQLTHEAEVFGTLEDDGVEILRQGDGSVLVRVSDGEGRSYFERVFVPDETREVRVFLDGGADRAVVRGSDDDGILVRVIGGGGDDRFVDATGRGSGRTIFYDAAGENDFVRGPETRVDLKRYEPPVGDTLTQNNEPPARDWGVSRTWFSPMVDWRSEIGPVVGVGPEWTRYGFRRSPYATRLGARVHVAPLEGLFGVAVEGRRRLTGDRGETRFEAEATQIAVTRFHGFGNDTPDGPNPDRMLVWTTRYDLSAGMTRFLTPRLHVGLGPTFSYVEPEPEPGSPAALLDVAGNESFGVGGLQLTVEHDSRDLEAYPRSGLHFTAAVSGYPLVWGDGGDAFVRSVASAATYLPVPFPLETTLALRAGGEHVAGNGPFQYAATLGGGSSLRGHRTDRFTGDASVFGTAELRTSLGRVDLLLARGDIGTIALADAGRVFLSGHDSGGWHSAFGGGLWFGPIDRTYTAHVLFAIGERQSLSAGLGMPF